MEDEGLGFRFYAILVGLVLAGGIALFILMLLFGWAIEAWGLFGALVVFVLVLLGIAWWHDRREVRRYEAEPE